MNATVRPFEHSLALPFFGTGMKTDLFLSLISKINMEITLVPWTVSFGSDIYFCAISHAKTKCS